MENVCEQIITFGVLIFSQSCLTTMPEAWSKCYKGKCFSNSPNV